MQKYEWKRIGSQEEKGKKRRSVRRRESKVGFLSEDKDFVQGERERK